MPTSLSASTSVASKSGDASAGISDSGVLHYNSDFNVAGPGASVSSGGNTLAIVLALVGIGLTLYVARK